MLSSSSFAASKSLGFASPLTRCCVKAGRRLPPTRRRYTNRTKPNLGTSPETLIIRKAAFIPWECTVSAVHTRGLHSSSNTKSPETDPLDSPDQGAQLDPNSLQIRGQHNRSPNVTPEDAAKWARETFRDDPIPDGVLTPAEMKVYIRLFGEPIFRTTYEPETAQGNDVGNEKDGGVELQERAEAGTWETVDRAVEEAPEGEVIAVQDVEGLELEAIEDIHEEDITAVTNLAKGEDLLDEAFVEEDDIDEDDDVIREDQEWETDEAYLKTHPYTLATRFGTSPGTVFFPKSSFTDPISRMLEPVSKANLKRAAEDIFGGVGLPYSPSTAARSRSMEQRPIPLSARQGRMKDVEADVYMSSVLPQNYAAVTGILTEVRKRLGSEWLRGLFESKKETGSGPFILDAGAGGAGIMAWRDIVRAEFGEEKTEPKQMGKASVVTGSDTLRRRVAKLLDETTFLPRLPDRVADQQPTNHAPRKQYDVIIASHQIWPLKKDLDRKLLVESLWSLLNPNGGVLILLEKGIPRGFEALAGARDHIRKRLMINPEADTLPTAEEVAIANKAKNDKPSPHEQEPTDAGMIIAPCTNHKACPMYRVPGLARGRKDWCSFQQRYVRPQFLQNILGAKKRNHDDVEFSYLAVMRGVDLRAANDHGIPRVIQDETTTRDALRGYGSEKKMEKEGYARVRKEKALRRQNMRSAALLESNLSTADAEDLPEEEIVDEDEVLVSSEGEEKHLAGESLAATEESLELAESQTVPPQLHFDHKTTPFTLPRAIDRPLKRKGHIVLDVCTPSGTIERWFMSKKCGRSAYRDARHSRWGDLWPLGAYSRTPRNLRVGTVDSKTGRVGGTSRAAARKAREDLDREYELDGIPQDNFDDLDDAEPEEIRQSWAEMKEIEEELEGNSRSSRKTVHRH